MYFFLPFVDNENYEVSIYCSSNTAVITNNCMVIQPLEDKEVNIFYKVTNKVTGEYLKNDYTVTVKVIGKYDSSNINRPEILPSIREWAGMDNFLSFSGNIVCVNEELKEVAEQIALYITDYTGLEIKIISEFENYGDMLINIDDSLSVGNEGYTISIDNTIDIKAPTKKGILYAGATIAQMLLNDKRVPKGYMRDYPQYEYRGFMIDTARYYIPLDYLEEITKYAGFFKMNRIHLHINDGGGESETAFRIKSDKYPALNRGIVDKCKNGEEKLWSKSDFINYQKAVQKYGIEVVPEIDAPSHCGCICLASCSEEAKAFGFSEAGINSWQLDLRDEKFENPVKFLQSIFDEFIGCDEPVFLGSTVHFGTDEWIKDDELEEYGMSFKERNEMMRRFMDEMIKYVNSKGYKPMLWNGLNTKDKTYGGDTSVSKNALFETWAFSFADLNVSIDEEYEFVNAFHCDLYVVPGVTYYKNDMQLEKLYKYWEVEKFWNLGFVNEGHPLMKGAESSIWLDANCALSHTDLFKLVKDQIVFMSEKTWYGKKTEGHNFENFKHRIDVLAQKAPMVNPERNIPSQSDGLIAKYDFSVVSDNSIKDLRGNSYNAVLHNVVYDIQEHSVKLNGSGFIEIPIFTVTDPYTVKFKMKISSENTEKAILFSSKDALIYFEKGKIFFERKGYSFCFNQEIETDKWVDFEISSRDKKTVLCVDGAKTVEAEYIDGEYEYTPKTERIFYTLPFPINKIGEGIKGYISDFVITKG